MKDFPNILRAKRKAIEVSQRELANALGVSQTSVNQWEVGGSVPTFFLVDALADYLECSVDELVGREGYKYTPPKKMREFQYILYGKMLEKGFKYESLSKQIGLSQSALRSWTSGNTYPDLKCLCLLADALKCSIDELMGRKSRW